jgi:carbon monoxide dehydrogenase subunit G
VRIRGEVIVDAPIEPTWSALADIASHVEWMADAESITFTSAQRTGVGVTFDCRTKVGPFTTTDKMTVTSWDERSAIGVRHTGIVVGTGVFELSEVSALATKVTWTEDLRFPLWLGGAVTAALAKPVLKRIWRGNLHRFSTVVSRRYLKN